MRYDKPATTINEQVSLLRARGMLWTDEALVRRWLMTVGYYRLSAYWLIFELPATPPASRSKTFQAGTTFDSVIDLYTFDRKLRLLVMEAIERVEVALRSRWTNRMAVEAGCHAHLDRQHFVSGWDHIDSLAKLSRETLSSKESFVLHYKKNYTDPFLPPIWMATEQMTFGQLSMWLTSTKNVKLKSAIARDFGLPDSDTLDGCIQYLAYVRNICAHHGRLWNRKTVKRLPHIKRLVANLVINNSGAQRGTDNRIYNCLVILSHLILHQSSDSTYPARVRDLLLKRSSNQLAEMGVPLDWQSRPIWSQV